MDGDPVAHLTLRAILDYQLDPRKYHRNDPRWWLVLRGAREQVRRRELAEYNQAQFQYTIAHLPQAWQLASVDDGELYRQAKGEMTKTLTSLLKCLLPWHNERDAETTRKEMAKTIDDVYRSNIGDPDDPRFVNRLNQAINTVYAGLGQAVKESDEDVFIRRKQQLEEKRRLQWGIKDART